MPPNSGTKSKSGSKAKSKAKSLTSPSDAVYQKMFNWAAKSGGKIHPSIQIKKSVFGGHGLFTKSFMAEETTAIKLTQSCSYSIMSLHVIKNFIHETATDRESWGRTKPIFDACVGDVDDEDAGNSGVVCIRNFMWAFFISLASIKSVRLPPISEVETYIKVLLSTPVVDVDTSFTGGDTSIESLIKKKKSVRKDFEILMQKCPEFKEVFTFDTAFQLHQAVCARILQIPNTSSPDVNLALVPFVDLVRYHSTEFNAEFAQSVSGFDPSDRSFTLTVKRNLKPGQEMFIRNTDTSNVRKCMETRGYVPQAPRSFTWDIPEWKSVVAKLINEDEKDAEMVALWLKVKPEIALEQQKAGYVVLDESSFRLPLLLIPGLTYNRKGAYRYFSDISESDFDALSNSEIYSKVESMAGSTAHGVLYNNTPIQLHDILKQTGSDSQEQIEVFAKGTTDLLFALGSVPRVQEDFSKMKLLSTYNGALEQYEKEKESMLVRFFATPYDEMLKMVRRSIQNYQYEVDSE